jgi:hypothetical protein
MNQLKSIIAVNAYVPKKINRYEVAGGCIVQGTNGAGKTSLLRLSLLFFGVKPHEIANIAGKGNRFHDYYLKTNSSYIAFEYEKSGKTLLVVVYAKTDGELRYRFLDTAYDEKLFIDDFGQFIKTENFKSHVQAKFGIRVGNEFSPSQYKEIIQSGVRKPMNSPNAPEINQAKGLYSLCDPNKTIGDVDRIMTSIISSKPSFQSVKALIARDLVGLEDRLQQTSYEGMYDPKQWEEQRILLRQAVSLAEKQSFLQEMDNEDAVLASIEQQLSGAKKAAELLLTEQQSAVNDYIQKQEDYEATLARVEDGYQHQRLQLEPSLSRAKADKHEKSHRIDHLEQKWQAYQQQDIDALQMKATRLSSLQDQLMAQQLHFRELEQNFAHISHLFDQRRSQLQLEHQREQTTLKQQLDGRQADIRQRKEKERDERDLALAQLQSLFESQLSDLDRLQRQQHGVVSALEERIKHPISDELTALTEQIEQMRKEMDRFQTEWLAASQQEKIHEQQHQQLVKSRDEQLNQFHQAKREQQLLEKQRDDFQNSLKHVENMLYFRLLAKSAHHADLATRSLREELLKMPVDESLEVSVGDIKLLGCELDLSQILPIEVLDRQRLEQSLQATFIALSACQSSQDALSHALSQLDKRIKQSDEARVGIVGKVKQLTYQQEALKQELTLREQQRTTQQQKLRLSLEASLSGAKQMLAVSEQSRQTLLRDRQQQKDVKEKTYQQALRVLETEQQTSQANFAQLLAEIQIRFDDHIASLTLENRQALDQAGADTQAIDSQKQQLHHLQREVSSAQEATRLVSEYQLWLDEHYSVRDILKTELALLDEQILTMDNQLRLAHQAYQQESKRLKTIMTENDHCLAAARQEVQLISSLLAQQLREVGASADKPSVMPLSSYQLQQQINRLIDELAQHDKLGQLACAKIFNSFKQMRELGARVSEALQSQGLDDLDSVKQWRKHLPSLTYLLGEYLQGLIEDIEQQFSLLSQKLIDLDRSLDDQARRIKEKGRQISQRMNEMGTAFAQVERVEAHITSSIDQIGFKRSLSRAAKMAEEVQRLPAHEAIPEKFLDAVSQAIIDIDRYGKHLNIEQFIDIAVEVKNKGQLKPRIARNDKELNTIDSEGLSFLILLTLYMAIKNTMQQDHKVTLLWAIDELGKLHHENIEALMRMLKQEQVDFLCAEPHSNPKITNLFRHIYVIQDKGRVQKVDSQALGNPVQSFLQALKPQPAQSEL